MSPYSCINLPEAWVNSNLKKFNGDADKAREATFFEIVADEFDELMTDRARIRAFRDFLSRRHQIVIAKFDASALAKPLVNPTPAELDIQLAQMDLLLVQCNRLGEDMRPITPEIWLEWLTVRDAYVKEFIGHEVAEHNARQEKGVRETREREQKDAAARAEREARARAAAWNEEQRCKRIADRLQSYVLPELPPPNPIDYAKLQKLNKQPNKLRRELVHRWIDRFNKLPADTQDAWKAFHSEQSELFHGTGIEEQVTGGDDDDDGDQGDKPTSYIVTDEEVELYLDELPPGQRHIGDVDAVVRGLFDETRRDSLREEFAGFRTFNAGVRQALRQLVDPIDEIISPPAPLERERGFVEEDDQSIGPSPPPIVPQIIPTGVSVIHGIWYGGKSFWLYKLGQCVAAADTVQFEGIDIEHGPVCYVTRDLGADVDQIRPNVVTTRERLGLPISGRFKLTDDAVYVNVPESLDAFLDKHKAWFPCKLLIFDSLDAVTVGDLSTGSVMEGTVVGLGTILRRGLAKAIICSAQETKEGQLKGATLEFYASSGLLHLTHDGRGNVTVTIRKVKGDVPHDPLKYRRGKDGFPDLVGAKRKKLTAAETAILDELRPLGEVRDDKALSVLVAAGLIEGEGRTAQRNAWVYCRDTMATAGLLRVTKGAAGKAGTVEVLK